MKMSGILEKYREDVIYDFSFELKNLKKFCQKKIVRKNFVFPKISPVFF